MHDVGVAEERLNEELHLLYERRAFLDEEHVCIHSLDSSCNALAESVNVSNRCKRDAAGAQLFSRKARRDDGVREPSGVRRCAEERLHPLDVVGADLELSHVSSLADFRS